MNKQTNQNIALLILLICVVVGFLMGKKEHYNMGVINQLQAKGPQDTYLTGDAWKYIPWWYYNYPYTYGPWHIPTRQGKYSYYYTSPYAYNYYY